MMLNCASYSGVSVGKSVSIGQHNVEKANNVIKHEFLQRKMNMTELYPTGMMTNIYLCMCPGARNELGANELHTVILLETFVFPREFSAA